MNVIHVMSDQHQARLLGCEDHPYVITPNMDRLASKGMRFTRAYTQNPICTPSRVSILCGQYPHNHGYFGNGGKVTEGLPSYLDHFKKHGYRSGFIGNAHHPNDPKAWLTDHCDTQLFCNNEGCRTRGSDYFAYLKERGLQDKEDWIRLPEFPGQQHEGRPSLLPFEHSPEAWCAREANRFIDEAGDQPFCMQVSMPRPHQCYTPAQEFWDMYPDDLPLPDMLDSDQSHRPAHFQEMIEVLKKVDWLIEPKTFEAGVRRVWRGYLGLITQTDHALGMIMDHLETLGKTDDTIIIYGTDHGAYTGTFGIREKAPGICSEQVCRVPHLWYVPGVTDGSACDQLVQNIDTAPTMAALCDLPEMDWVDGRDISSLLRNSSEPVHDIVVTENAWSKSVRVGCWRFVHYQREMFDGKDVGDLYNIDEDPMETRNLYHDPDHQHIVEDMRRRLLEWLIGTTRNRSFNLPGLPEQEDGHVPYELSSDQKLTNSNSPRKALAGGFLNYM
jgi:choline-sulfatase/uncharacterized sulfatase